MTTSIRQTVRIDNVSYWPVAEPFVLRLAVRARARRVEVGACRDGWAPVRRWRLDGCGPVIGYLAARLLFAPYGVAQSTPPTSAEAKGLWRTGGVLALRNINRTVNALLASGHITLDEEGVFHLIEDAEHDERERGDDDGVEYGHPRDHRDGRE
jgi:hypothetical protein